MKTLIVSNSQLSTARTCLRKHWYKYQRGLELPVVEAPLNFGGAIHEGLAHFARTKDKKASIVKAMGSMREQPVDEKEWRTPDYLVEVLDKLLDQKLPVPLIAPNGEPVIEVDFECHLLDYKDYHILYKGKVDVIGNWDGREVLVDYKTTSDLRGDKRKGEEKTINPVWWSAFKPHGATPMYCWGINQVIGHPIRTVMIYGIGVSRSHDFCTGVQFFELTPNEIDEAVSRVELQVCQLVDSMEANTCSMEFNPDSCLDYNRPCPYLQLCRVPPQNRQALEGIYVRNEHAPEEEE